MHQAPFLLVKRAQEQQGLQQGAGLCWSSLAVSAVGPCLGRASPFSLPSQPSGHALVGQVPSPSLLSQRSLGSPHAATRCRSGSRQLAIHASGSGYQSFSKHLKHNRIFEKKSRILRLFDHNYSILLFEVFDPTIRIARLIDYSTTSLAPSQRPVQYHCPAGPTPPGRSTFPSFPPSFPTTAAIDNTALGPPQTTYFI